MTTVDAQLRRPFARTSSAMPTAAAKASRGDHRPERRLTRRTSRAMSGRPSLWSSSRALWTTSSSPAAPRRRFRVRQRSSRGRQATALAGPDRESSSRRSQRPVEQQRGEVGFVEVERKQASFAIAEQDLSVTRQRASGSPARRGAGGPRAPKPAARDRRAIRRSLPRGTGDGARAGRGGFARLELGPRPSPSSLPGVALLRRPSGGSPLSP